VTGILGSYRWRRRLLWTIPVLAGAAGAVVLVVSLPSGSGIPDDEPVPQPVAPVAPEPVAQPLRKAPVTPATRREVNAVLTAFLRDAVNRENPAAAWKLVTPALRAGWTRAEWRRGNLPVYPYPARVDEATGWRAVESFENDLLVDLLVHARPGAKEKGAIAFQIALKRLGTGGSRRWLIDSIIPERVYAPTPERPRRGAQSDAPGPATGARLSPYWFFVPGLLLSLIVLVPATIAVVNWRRGVRAEKAYRRSLPESD
jgi:hypothetical protein